MQDSLLCAMKEDLVKVNIKNELDYRNCLFSEGYLLKQKQYEARGIKLMQKVRPQGIPGERCYLYIATFKHVQPKPLNKFEMGFTSETKASDVIYQLEIYQMPKSIDELDMLSERLAVESSFNENQVINQLSEVTL